MAADMYTVRVTTKIFGVTMDPKNCFPTLLANAVERNFWRQSIIDGNKYYAGIAESDRWI